jgi:hypothetical protein
MPGICLGSGASKIESERDLLDPILFQWCVYASSIRNSQIAIIMVFSTSDHSHGMFSN